MQHLVIMMLIAPTLMAHMNVPARRDTLEMERFVKVYQIFMFMFPPAFHISKKRQYAFQSGVLGTTQEELGNTLIIWCLSGYFYM